MRLHHGDCLDVMAAMEPESVDAVVMDPPYGLGFMGKHWDHAAGAAAPTEDVSPMRRRPEHDAVNAGMSRQGGRQWRGTDGQKRQARDARSYGQWCEAWAAEMLRVAKPSAYLLAFGGTRTVHRMTVAIEDAGWIIRDMLVWAYASGFPKSKASLKPAWEPIVMARKPGPLRELAIDACRIGPPLTEAEIARTGGVMGESDGRGIYGNGNRLPAGNDGGRWPANVILTDPIFDGGWDGVVGGGIAESGWRNGDRPAGALGIAESFGAADVTGPHYRDGGTYSRFFLLPKADRTDREPVLGALAAGLSGSAAARPSTRSHHASASAEDESIRIESAYSTVCAKCGRQRVNVPGAACQCPEPEWVRKPQTTRANVHPTVKPVDLMRHLVRLVTPTGGIVLDPFAGSGSTLLAAEMEGFEWIGVEREAEYVAIAEARLNGTQRGLGLPA